MRNNEPLPLGEKLRQVRQARKMSQKKVAEATKYAISSISHIEVGRIDCDPDILLLIRKALGIEKMPLLDPERKVFKDKLLAFYDLILEWKHEEAKEMQEELSNIKFLPFERELNTYYNLLKCRLLLSENRFDEAAEILEVVGENLQEMDEESTYFYYCNMGVLNMRTANEEVAMEFFLKANKLVKLNYKGHDVLYYNIARCSMKLGFLVRSIDFLEKWNEMFLGEKSYEHVGLWVDSMLARGYIRMNRLQSAKSLLEKCLTKAKRINNKRYMGMIFYDYGFMYKAAGAGNSAIEYLDRALECFEKGEINYMEVLYLKVLCYIDMKYNVSCMQLIAEGKKLAEGSEMYTVFFESAKHLTSLSNHKSTQYIEGVTIPYMLKTFSFYAALVYSEALREYFESKGGGFGKKALQMAEISRGIYKRMMEGGDFE